jgi:uncharacterized RmlC-like cupin family protein
LHPSELSFALFELHGDKSPGHSEVPLFDWFAITVLCTVWNPFEFSESNKMTGPHDHTHHAHDHDHSHGDAERWKHDGVRVIPGNQLDPNVPSTAGMDRKAAINFARVGAQKLWAGTVTIRPDAKTGAHHHGHLESIIFVVKGKARMRWGEQLQFTAEAGPGDFIFVPPYVPHQEINASRDEVLECVLVRSDGEAVAINLDIEPVEKPETVLWIDPVHRDPAEKK